MPNEINGNRYANFAVDHCTPH